MKCTFSELRNLEVINVADGTRIGTVDDVEIDGENGSVTALIICGRPRLMGLMGKEDDVVISMKDIVRIGNDTVLVNIARFRDNSPLTGGNISDLFESNKKHDNNI